MYKVVPKSKILPIFCIFSINFSTYLPRLVRQYFCISVLWTQMWLVDVQIGKKDKIIMPFALNMNLITPKLHHTLLQNTPVIIKPTPTKF